MEYYQAVSLKLIERMLLGKEYRKKSQIRDHLGFLEHLANSLNEKVLEQKNNGILPWETEYELKKVRELFMKLSEELHNMDLIDLDKNSRRKDLF